MKYIAESKCPKCGETMQHGIVYCGGRAIVWMPTEPDYVEDRWKCDVSECFRINGLAMTYSSAAEKYPVAYHCPNCRKIVLDY